MSGRVHLLFLAHVVVLSKVTVEMGFQLLISDKSLATIGALELYAFVEFSYGDNVEFLEHLRILFDHGEVEEVAGSILGRQTLVDLVKEVVELGIVLAVDTVLGRVSLGLVVVSERGK